MKCPFCNINKEKTVIINEGKNTRVILSNPKLMQGHLLVIPKRHVEKISQLEKNEREELFDKVIEFQEKILVKIAKGCDIRQNFRQLQKEDNLKVNHLHIHLQPREFEDKLYNKSQIFEKQIFSELTKQEKDKIIKIFVNFNLKRI